MNELIKVSQNENGTKTISARDLYDFLEIKANFTDWCKRMFEYGFEEGKDFITILGESTGGRPSSDFALSISTAKEISMVQRSEKGKEARQYFIECENKLMSVSKKDLLLVQLFSNNHLEVVFAHKELLALETAPLIEKIEQQAPKVEFYDQVANTTTSFDMQEVAGMLKLSYGRNILFKKLRNAKVLMNDNLPYRNLLDDGKFIVVETKWIGQPMATTQTRITQKGLDWLQKNKEKLGL